MSALLTCDQAELLKRYGHGWVLGDIIAVPQVGIRSAIERGSGAMLEHWEWQTDAKGVHAIRYHDRDARQHSRDGRPVEVPWTLVRRAVAAMPDRLVRAVVDARREHQRQVQRRVAPFLPGGYAPFVYPNPAWEREALDRLTAAAEAAVDAVSEHTELALFEVSA